MVDMSSDSHQKKNKQVLKPSTKKKPRKLSFEGKKTLVRWYASLEPRARLWPSVRARAEVLAQIQKSDPWYEVRNLIGYIHGKKAHILDYDGPDSILPVQEAGSSRVAQGITQDLPSKRKRGANKLSKYYRRVKAKPEVRALEAMEGATVENMRKVDLESIVEPVDDLSVPDVELQKVATTAMAFMQYLGGLRRMNEEFVVPSDHHDSIESIQERAAAYEKSLGVFANTFGSR